MPICNYVIKIKGGQKKCKNEVEKNNKDGRCSTHKKCLHIDCNSICKIKGYCAKHYRQIICAEKQKNNCSSPSFLCDESIGDFSDIEISESFFDKPVCYYTEDDLPSGDDLFEGIEEEEKPTYSAKATGTKITIFDHLKAFVRNNKEKEVKKDGRKRKSRRKSGKKSRRKSSKRKSIK